jgi:hypothetical protein
MTELTLLRDIVDPENRILQVGDGQRLVHGSSTVHGARLDAASRSGVRQS